MTLQEYLEDYASPETKAAGEALIQREIPRVPRERTREILIENLDKIRGGLRDFRF